MIKIEYIIDQLRMPQEIERSWRHSYSLSYPVVILNLEKEYQNDQIIE